MRKLLITDLHFGCHQNSIIWLNSQLEFFYKQFIPQLNSSDIIYCLGDVFDVRSSVNAMIASKVRDLFIKITSICPCYIIGGNHDYFSPDSDDFCNIDLILSNIENLYLITHNILEIENDVLIPWYEQENKDITSLTKQYKGKNIFTHTDLMTFKHKLYTKVYSGHIHTPLIKGNLINLGSTFPLTFVDYNSERGYYILENDKLEFIPNKYCIKFWRSYNEECFKESWWKDKDEKDYIELYIKQEHMYDDYMSFINEIKKNYQHLSIIPAIENNIYESFDVSFDIMTIVESNIPENLKETFEKLKVSM